MNELLTKKTKNNTLIIEYIPEKKRQELLNEIWKEREDYLNKGFDQTELKRRIASDAITGNKDSFLGNYDKETHRIQERECYATYINFMALVNELKALTPLYKEYTIISFVCRGMEYDFERDVRGFMNLTTDIDGFDCYEELIAEPFDALIRLLKNHERICRNFYIYEFSVELGCDVE